MAVMVSADIGNQVRVESITSSYPQNTAEGGTTRVGNIALGANVNDATTKTLAQIAFNQGQFYKAVSKVDFNKLATSQKSNGDETFTYTKTVNGQSHTLTMRKSDMLESVVLEEVKSQSQIDAVAKKYKIDRETTYITVDGKKYFVRLNIPMHFGVGNQNSIIIDTVLFVVGTEALGAAVAGVISSLGIGAFAAALASINTAVFKVLWSAVSGALQMVYVFTQAFIGGLVAEGGGVAAAWAAGVAAVGEAAEGAFVAITASALAYTLVGVLVVATIYLILTYALHYTYQNVYLYNLTKYELDFDFGYIYEGSDHNVLTKTLAPLKSKTGPNNINLGEWYSATAFRFQSDSKFHGLGYAMTFSLKDPKTGAIVQQMACMFDIPFAGNNSLMTSATLPSNIKTFYSSNEGKVKKTQHSSQNNNFEIITTYDYLSGKHPDPETGDSEYLYNSLIIIREKSKVFSINPSAKLSGSGHLSVPSNAAYEFGTGDFTIQAWIKPTRAGTIFGKKSTAGGSGANAGLLLVLQPDGKFKLATDNGFGYSQVVTDASNVFDGDWHHVSAVRSGSSMTVFVDGQQISATLSGSLASPLNVSNDLPLLIGSVQQNQEPYIHYEGSISHARVWNIALDAAKLRQTINSEVSSSSAGLVGDWTLHTDGSDRSATHNNASVSGSVSFGAH